MKLRPEQLQVLDYLRCKGTEASVASIRSRVTRAFIDLDRRLATIDGERARVRPGPGSWSVQEIADHLVESHRPAVPELAALVAGRRPEGGPIAAGLQSSEPFARGWGELCDELSRVHRACLTVLEKADEDSPLHVRAPVAMVVKCTVRGASQPVEWTAELDWKAYAVALRGHVLEHVRQIDRTLTSVAG